MFLFLYVTQVSLCVLFVANHYVDFNKAAVWKPKDSKNKVDLSQIQILMPHRYEEQELSLRWKKLGL